MDNKLNEVMIRDIELRSQKDIALDEFFDSLRDYMSTMKVTAGGINEKRWQEFLDAFKTVETVFANNKKVETYAKVYKGNFSAVVIAKGKDIVFANIGMLDSVVETASNIGISVDLDRDVEVAFTYYGLRDLKVER